MFTGLVELIGTVTEYQAFDTSESGGNGVSITIGDSKPILSDVHLGDSISVNGTCLTVTKFSIQEGWFKVGVSNETLRRTNLGSLTENSKVNLERAVTSDVRLGGHIVQGHVDTIASITDIKKDGNSIIFTFKLRDTEFINYIIEKGFIALDGTSLTVISVDYKNFSFQIMMVSYTQSKVVMTTKSIGDHINVEVDLTGKLIEKQIELQLENQINKKDSNLSKLIERIIERKLSEKLSKIE